MRKHVAWTMLLLLMAGCSGEVEMTPSRVPIHLTTEVRPVVSRAPVGVGSDFEAALYRWDYNTVQNSSGSWMTETPTEEKHILTVLTDGSLQFKRGGQFFYMTDNGGGIYYTSFKAVTPVGVQDADGLGVTFTDEQMDGTQDVMTTNFANAGFINEPKLATLIFQHQLAQFKFRATKLATSEVQTVSAITLKSVSLIRHIALSIDETIEYSTMESLPLMIANSGVNLTEEDAVEVGEPVMIKAGITELAFEITAIKSGGETVTIPAKATFDVATVAGKSYLITLDFNKGEVPELLEVTATIGAWISGTGGDATFDDV